MKISSIIIICIILIDCNLLVTINSITTKSFNFFKRKNKIMYTKGVIYSYNIDKPLSSNYT